MNRAILTSITLFLIGSVSAWGPLTHRYFCEEAVETIWGQRGIECLNVTKLKFCEVLEDKQRDACMINPVQSWDLPEVAFKDEELHQDYSRCPIIGHDREWICGDPADSFASDTAASWFERSKSSKSTCERVHKFCIGSHYLTDSQFSVHQTKYDNLRCMGELEEGVDERIYDKNWTVKKNCWFSHSEWRGGINRTVRYRQFFKVTHKTIENVLGNLISEGEAIASIPLVSTTTTTVKGAEIELVLFEEETTPNTTETAYDDVNEELNATLRGIMSLLGSMEKPPERKPRNQGDMGYMWWFIGFIFVLGTGITFYALVKVGIRKERHGVVRPTNMLKINGINEEVEDKLLNCGITSIPKLVETETKKLAKATGISEKRIELWKQAQLKMFDNYFRLNSLLKHEDLTKYQLKEVIGMKTRIGEIMQQYKDEEKLSDTQKEELRKMLWSLNPDEKVQIERLIRGEVVIEEDLAFRIWSQMQKS